MKQHTLQCDKKERFPVNWPFRLHTEEDSGLKQSSMCLLPRSVYLPLGQVTSLPGNVFSWDNLQPFTFSFLINPGNQIHRKSLRFMSRRGISRHSPPMNGNHIRTMELSNNEIMGCDKQRALCVQLCWASGGIFIPG